MSILLLILKIIGWILLAILGIIVLLLLIFFLHPVTYKGELEAEKDFALWKFNFNAKWLFGLLKIDVYYKEKSVDYAFKVFGRKIEEKEEKQTVKPQSAQKNEQKSPPEKESDLKSSKKNDTVVKQSISTQANKQIKKPASKQKKTKIRNTESKFREISEKIKSIKNIFSDQNNQKAFQITLNELKYLCKHFGPRKLKANLDFSMGDPANTGILLGIISVMPVVYSKGVKIRPDFSSDDLYLFGNASFKGRIRSIHLLKTLIVAFIKKETRTIILTLIKN